jgi:uncharacterized protein YbbC (DUF1343 family)
MIEGKSVALVVNHTSTYSQTHLVDTLLALNINIKAIFSPEHGFRGNHSNGAKVKNEIDSITHLPIISLYGKNKKPFPEQLAGIDVIIFDIQDVGARFYTYISTMHYIMEACAENNIQLIILDRPNPNGHYVDGPVLKPAFNSFVGIHPIPIVHGMTLGEIAKMIIGEGWIDSAAHLNLTVIPLKNWTHSSTYLVPIAPSPNLPTDRSINLYPSLCLFEGTSISVGRGTKNPFQTIGYPDQIYGAYQFTPIAIPGVSDYPKHEDKICFGIDLRKEEKLNKLDLSYLIEYYNKSNQSPDFFNSFFVKLAGTDELQKQIENGWTEAQIRNSWQDDLDKFKELRSPYLLYE